MIVDSQCDACQHQERPCVLGGAACRMHRQLPQRRQLEGPGGGATPPCMPGAEVKGKASFRPRGLPNFRHTCPLLLTSVCTCHPPNARAPVSAPLHVIPLLRRSCNSVGRRGGSLLGPCRCLSSVLAVQHSQLWLPSLPLTFRPLPPYLGHVKGCLCIAQRAAGEA